MVVTTAILAAVALMVADVAGLTLLRSGLVSRVDAQLDGQARGLSRVGQRPPTDNPRQPRPGPGFGGGSRVYLYAADGTRLYSSPSNAADEPRLDGFAALKARAGGRPFTVDGTDGTWRVKVVEVASGRENSGQGNSGQENSGREYAVHAVSLHAIEVTEQTLILVDAAVTVLVLLLIALAAASVVRIGLRPLTSMEKIATEIAGGNLSRRVPDTDPHTESGRLGTALNIMLVRIEAALADRTASERRLRQFLADASHELRTPLTSIQGFAELYRRGGAPPGPALDEAMGRIESEVGRMRLLVNDLLLLARLDEERPLQRHPVDLLAVAADAVRDAHVRVPSRFVQLAALDDDSETFEAVTVAGDEPRIRQVVTNLLANALQHTPDDAAVAVRVGRSGGAAPDAALIAGPAPITRPAPITGPAPITRPAPIAGPVPIAAIGANLPADAPAAVVEVTDTGPGMAPDDARHVFERLYRADHSRSRRHGGAGLGLAIVAAIVQAHGGRVELYTAAGAGARFRVLLPVDPDRLDPDRLDPDRLPASYEETSIPL